LQIKKTADSPTKDTSAASLFSNQRSDNETTTPSPKNGRPEGRPLCKNSVTPALRETFFKAGCCFSLTSSDFLQYINVTELQDNT
jgi:hypothetical protein